jgi:acetyl esterase/lipase
MTIQWKTQISLCLVTMILTAFSLSLTPQLSQRQQPTYDVVTVGNLLYYDDPDFHPRKHLLDIYKPQDLVNAPVLLFIHGGGWQRGDKLLYAYLGRAFASRGFTTVVINYRLSPEVRHPTHVQDVARALAWIYRNISAHGGNPEAIFVMGHSAGGHLAALLALDETYLEVHGLSTSLIRGVMPMSGVYNLNAIPGFHSVFTSDPQARHEASPIAHVDEEQPPFFISYAQFDLPTLHEQARELSQRLTAHGTEARLLEAPRKDHITIISQLDLPDDATRQALIEFMQEHLP